MYDIVCVCMLWLYPVTCLVFTVDRMFLLPPRMQPMRRNTGSSYLSSESDLGFWERDIETLLANDLPLRKKIGKHFIKVQAATGIPSTYISINL